MRTSSPSLDEDHVLSDEHQSQYNSPDRVRLREKREIHQRTSRKLEREWETYGRLEVDLVDEEAERGQREARLGPRKIC